MRAVLRLALSQAGRPAGESAVLDLVRYASERRLDLAGAAWVAVIGKRLAFAAVPLGAAGGVSLILCPQILPRGVDTGLAAAVIDAAARDQGSRGCRMLQGLLETRAFGVHAAFSTAGFTRLAELLYLQQALHRWPPSRKLVLPPKMELHHYEPASHGLFAAAIERSYIGSLDCPALAGKRPIEDVIAGHQAAGEYHPEWWHVLVERSANRTIPLGVLLLAGIGRGAFNGVELVYLGLAPGARGRGLGDVLMHHAASIAYATPGRCIMLAVDAENAPALALYERHGFRRLQSRIAMFRMLSVG